LFNHHLHLKLKKNNFNAEVSTKQAESDFAYELQAAKTRQKIMREQMTVQVIERKKDIEIQEKVVQLKQLQLEATVKKPATAERSKIELLAAATKQKIVKESEGNASLTVAHNLGEPIKLVGSANVDVMNAKATAWKQYNEAAMVTHIIDVLPDLASAIARPLSRTKEITIVNEDNEPQGSSKLVTDVSGIITQLPVIVESFTGVNITNVMKSAQLATVKKS